MSRDDRADDYDDRPRRRDYEPHRGVLVLVLGILGLVACAPLGIAAWLMGSADLKKMDAGTMDPEGRQLTLIGKILGIVASILMVIGLCFMVIYFVAIAAFLGMAVQDKGGPAQPPARSAPADADERLTKPEPIKSRPTGIK